MLQRRVRKCALGLTIALVLAIRPALAGVAETEANLQKLKQSLTKWAELKAKCGGNYSYAVRWQSWVGFGNETVIVVRKQGGGTQIRRVLQSTCPDRSKRHGGSQATGRKVGRKG